MNCNNYIYIFLFLGIAVQFVQASYFPFSLFFSKKNESDPNCLNRIAEDTSSLDPKLINKDATDRVETMQCNDSKNASNNISLRLKEQLIESIESNNVEVLKYFLKNNFDPNFKDANGKFPLHYSIKKNNLEITNLLIEYGADVKALDNLEHSPLYYAFYVGNLSIAKLLFDKGAIISNNFDKEILPSLRKAAAFGFLNVVQIILENNSGKYSGIDTEKDTDDYEYYKAKWEEEKDTALIDAIHGKYYEIAKLLIEHGANYKSDVAKRYNYYRGKDLDYKFLNSLKPAKSSELHNNKEEQKRLFEALKEWDIDLIDSILYNGLNPNFIDEISGYCPLNWVIFESDSENLDFIDLLIFHGADVNFIDRHGNDPIHYAFEKNHFRIAKFLFDSGANIRQDTDLESLPSISEAIKNNLLKLAQFHLKNEKNYDSDYDEETRIYLMNEYKFKIFIQAIQANHFDIVEFLINHVVDINKAHYTGETPIHYATLKDNLKIIKLLVDKGANVNCMNKIGFTPLHYAAYGKDNFEILEYLVQNNANVNSIDNDGKTPLNLAVDSENIEKLNFLINNGANLNNVDKNNQSALRSAIRKKRFDIVKILTENGADLNNPPSLFKAVDLSNIEITKYLLEKNAEFDSSTNYGKQILYTALGQDSSEIRDLLLKFDKNPNKAKCYEELKEQKLNKMRLK